MAEHGELLEHAGGVALSPERPPRSGKSGTQRERESTPPKSRQKDSALKVSKDLRRRREQCLMVAFSWSCRAPPRAPSEPPAPLSNSGRSALGPGAPTGCASPQRKGLGGGPSDPPAISTNGEPRGLRHSSGKQLQASVPREKVGLSLQMSREVIH